MVDTPTDFPAAPTVPESARATRADLRARLRAERAALDGDVRARNARAVRTHLMPVLESLAPRHVAGYLAVGGELDPAELLAGCRRSGIVTLLPVVDGATLGFSPFDENSAMRPNRFGIDEPLLAPEARLVPHEIDAVLVPLVGFDAGLDRLGMGGGFYDRSFAARRGATAPPWLIGIAHEIQRVDDVHPDWWDVPLDMVVTEAGVTRRERPART